MLAFNTNNDNNLLFAVNLNDVFYSWHDQQYASDFKNSNYNDAFEVLESLKSSVQYNAEKFSYLYAKCKRMASNISEALAENATLMNGADLQLSVYAELVNVEVLRKLADRDLDELTESEKQLLEQLANSPTRAGVLAKNALLIN